MKVRYLLMSDTHGELQRTLHVIREHSDVDGYIHLGDVGFDEQYLPKMRIVCGNHDRHKYPEKLVLSLSGLKTLLVHGHRFEYELVERMQNEPNLWKDWDGCMNVLYDTISAYAKQQHYDMVLFGHTHTAHFEQRNGIWICNPGSLCFSHDGKQPSYAILDIQEKHVRCNFYFMEEEEV